MFREPTPFEKAYSRYLALTDEAEGNVEALNKEHLRGFHPHVFDKEHRQHGRLVREARNNLWAICRNMRQQILTPESTASIELKIECLRACDKYDTDPDLLRNKPLDEVLRVLFKLTPEDRQILRSYKI